MRGSFDFDSIEQYRLFLRDLFARLNRGRRERFLEDRRRKRSTYTATLPTSKEAEELKRQYL